LTILINKILYIYVTSYNLKKKELPAVL